METYPGELTKPKAILQVYEARLNGGILPIKRLTYRPGNPGTLEIEGYDGGMVLTGNDILEVKCNQGHFRWRVGYLDHSYFPDWYWLSAARI